MFSLKIDKNIKLTIYISQFRNILSWNKLNFLLIINTIIGLTIGFIGHLIKLEFVPILVVASYLVLVATIGGLIRKKRSDQTGDKYE